MSDSLKNRLVGTIILVALAVIILPQWLDGEKQVSQQNFVDIPEMPDELEMQAMQEVDIAKIKETVESPDVIEDIQPQDEIFQQTSASIEANESPSEPVNSTAESSVQKATEVTKNSLSVETDNNKTASNSAGWVIQLGSFSDKANVRKLMKTLSDAGYLAYSEPVNTRLGELTKVFIGPELDRTKLETALSQLRELTGLNGKITEYRVSAG